MQSMNRVTSCASMVGALFGLALGLLALWPLGDRLLARHRASQRLARVDRPADAAPLDWIQPPAGRLGGVLASWQTIGGCGAGGANGTGVKWIGRSTTGGLFQLMVTSNFIDIPRSAKPGQGAGGYNYILNAQVSRDLNEKWNLGLSVPYLYKHYNDPFMTGAVSNAGIGDVNALVTRRLGAINATALTASVGLPTGTYRAEYMKSALTPDEQLGFGRVTATLQVEQTMDRLWGLIVAGAAANYRGGKNDAHNYRAPGATAYGYAGYFVGALVPTVGLNLTGFTRQDTRGDFGETLDAPVATAAAHASVEWSNAWVAVLAGAYFPVALRGQNWHSSGGFALQPFTLALGISVSPF
jgi:hypothetical protein